MGYRLREIEAESKFSSQLTLEAIGRAVPMDEVRAVILEEGVQETRERKLNISMVVLLVVAMNIYTHLSITRRPELSASLWV